MTAPWASEKRLANALDCSPSELRQLASQAGKFYEPFDLCLPGKKPRHIDNPRGDLRRVQKLITRRILRHLPFPGFLYGSIRKRSAIQMAGRHIGSPCVVAVDIRACFPSTSDSLVRKALVQHAGFGRQTAALLTRLTTVHGGLPQGAPSSSYLLNLATMDIHSKLNRRARILGLVYTVFVDDIVVSGTNPEPMLDHIATELRESGLQLSHKKKRVMRSSDRSVLGLTLNPSLDAPAPFYDRIDSLIARTRERGFMTNRQRAQLSGMVNHVRAVNPSHGDTLSRIVELLLAETLIENEIETKPTHLRIPCKHRRRHKRRNGSNLKQSRDLRDIGCAPSR